MLGAQVHHARVGAEAEQMIAERHRREREGDLRILLGPRVREEQRPECDHRQQRDKRQDHPLIRLEN